MRSGSTTAQPSCMAASVARVASHQQSSATALSSLLNGITRRVSSRTYSSNGSCTVAWPRAAVSVFATG